MSLCLKSCVSVFLIDCWLSCPGHEDMTWLGDQEDGIISTHNLLVAPRRVEKVTIKYAQASKQVRASSWRRVVRYDRHLLNPGARMAACL
jgi:hypothetical protein